MNFFMQMIVILLFVSSHYCCANDILAGHYQLLVVTTRNWNEIQGSLQLYEREENDTTWYPKGERIPVVIGKTGLAWGIGLHPKIAQTPFKAEGDGKSPAGIFSLGTAFGFASNNEMSSLKIEYLQLNEDIEAVDDPLSRHYNQIVNRKEVILDWCSSEKMGTEPLYKIGLVINHNFPNPQAGAGSAIFLHIWRNKCSGTAGCTAMSEENLSKVLSWLNVSKYPVLVQLPIFGYHELKDGWNLP